MNALSDLIDANHGVVTTSALHEIGYTRHRIASAVERNQLIRVAKGRFLAREFAAEPSPATQARLLRGSLSCVNALEHHGIWVPARSDARIHIRVPKSRLQGGWDCDPVRRRYVPDAELHVIAEPWRGQFPSLHDPVSLATLAADRCLGRDELVAVLDSTLRQLKVSYSDLRRLTCYGNETLREAYLHATAGADSGLESLVRMRLFSLRLKFRIQQSVCGWRVDFLLGNWLVLEIDGFEYHSRQGDFSRDRRKDRELQAAGFTVLRFTYPEVVYEWPKVEAIILSFVRNHRSRRKRGGFAL